MGHNCLADQWGRRQEVEGAWGWREGGGGWRQWVGGSGWGGSGWETEGGLLLQDPT